MVDFVIGGKTYSVPPLNIKKLRVAWPYIKSLGQTGREVPDMASDIANVVSAGLGGTPTADELEEEMMVSDFERLNSSIVEFLRESGLTPKPGEAQAASTTVVDQV